MKTLVFSAFFIALSFSKADEYTVIGMPRLDSVMPRGATIGSEVEVTLRGLYMHNPRELLFYEPGITALNFERVEAETDIRGRETRPKDGTVYKVRFQVAKEARAGLYHFRLRTDQGLSEAHCFRVGHFESVAEAEPIHYVKDGPQNDSIESAEAARPATTIDGVLKRFDEDWYRLSATRGQRISAEVEGLRVPASTGRVLQDFELTLHNADGRELAACDDTALFLSDPFLSVIAPADGDYFIRVRDSVYSDDSAGHPYRLHLGHFPRPSLTYPLGGPAGRETTFTVFGDAKGTFTETIKLPNVRNSQSGRDIPAEDEGWYNWQAKKDGAQAPTPNRIRVSPFDNVMEKEQGESAGKGAVPCALNGRMDSVGDADRFTFAVPETGRYRVRAFAQSCGSAMDPVMTIRGPKGFKSVTRDDISGIELGYTRVQRQVRDVLDPVVSLHFREGEEYSVEIRDQRDQFGEEIVYRVEIEPDTPQIFTTIPGYDNNSPSKRDRMTIPRGNRNTIWITTRRQPGAPKGDLHLKALGLPEGVTMQAPVMTEGMERVPLVFEAKAAVKPQAFLVDLVARIDGAEETVPGGFRQSLTFMNRGNQNWLWHSFVEKLAVAVVEEAPFSVEVVRSEIPLAPNGELNLNVKVDRNPGFEKDVQVHFDIVPANVNRPNPLTFKRDESEKSLRLSANGRLEEGVQELALAGWTTGGNYRSGEGRIFVSSALQPLQMGQPFFKITVLRCTIEQGKTADLEVKLAPLKSFKGRAKISLRRLPRGVRMTGDPLEVESKEQKISFKLEADMDALLGPCKGVGCTLETKINGETVTQYGGYGYVRVDPARVAQTSKVAP